MVEVPSTSRRRPHRDPARHARPSRVDGPRPGVPSAAEGGGSGSTTRSPTHPRSSLRAERSTGRRTAGPRPRTARMDGRRCTHRRSPRRRPRCCPMVRVRPPCGASTSTRTGSRWTPRSSARWSRARPSSATRKRRRRSTEGARTRCSGCSPRSARPCLRRSAPGVGPASGCPRRRSCRAPAASA